jgi:antitoxin PrlF
MAKKKVEECCTSCCKVEAMVSVDERGQMVLPKDVREKIGIKAGDKLSLVSLSCGESLKCLALVRAEDLSRMAEEFLGPVMKEFPGGKR